MSLTQCRECEEEVAEKAVLCPSCGAADPGSAGGYGATNEVPSAWTIAGGVFVGVVAAGIVFGVVAASCFGMM